MEFLITVRTLIATTVMLFCSLWLARQLKIHRPRLPVSAVLILSLIMLFEPGMLAFLVWVVHDIALRFAIILPAAFAAVIFIEVPKMIWQDRASELVSSGWETFIVVAVINLILLSLTYRFKPSNTPAP